MDFFYFNHGRDGKWKATHRQWQAALAFGPAGAVAGQLIEAIYDLVKGDAFSDVFGFVLGVIVFAVLVAAPVGFVVCTVIGLQYYVRWSEEGERRPWRYVFSSAWLCGLLGAAGESAAGGGMIRAVLGWGMGGAVAGYTFWRILRPDLFPAERINGDPPPPQPPA